MAKQILPHIPADVYSATIKLPRWSAVRATTSGKHLLKSLHLAGIVLTKDGHKALAQHWHRRSIRLNCLWEAQFERACLQTFGRKSQIGDYRVCAIGCEEFSEEHKNELRRFAYGCSEASAIAYSYAQITHPRSHNRRLQLLRDTILG